jgi:hypothetical protein
MGDFVSIVNYFQSIVIIFMILINSFSFIVIKKTASSIFQYLSFFNYRFWFGPTFPSGDVINLDKKKGNSYAYF